MWSTEMHSPGLVAAKNGVVLTEPLFGAPRYLDHGPKKTASTAGRANVRKLGWNLAVSRKLFQFCVGGVPETIMPSHEFSLVVGSGNGVLIVILEDWRGVEGEGVMTKKVRVRGKLRRRR
jgi:hypothetical protein